MGLAGHRDSAITPAVSRSSSPHPGTSRFIPGATGPDRVAAGDPPAADPRHRARAAACDGAAFLGARFDCSTETLSGRDMRPVEPRVLPDALERLPGATLRNEQGNPYQPNLTLRGFVAS